MLRGPIPRDHALLIRTPLDHTQLNHTLLDHLQKIVQVTIRAVVLTPIPDHIHDLLTRLLMTLMIREVIQVRAKGDLGVVTPQNVQKDGQGQNKK